MNDQEKPYKGLLSLIDPERLPVHVAIIMDGNGRWAKGRGLPRIEGHRAGAKAVREAVTAAREIGVKVLTLYAFSVENWKRPRAEVSALMQLLRHFLKSEVKLMQEKGIRFDVIGRISEMAPAVQKAIEATRKATQDCSDMTLNLALNYGAKSEIEDAFKEMLSEAMEGQLDPESVNAETISQHLYTRDLPDPDLLIRTSNEYRISNFLLWQIAYAELWFTDVYWPDFGKTHLAQAIIDYQGRERRFGGIEPPKE